MYLTVYTHNLPPQRIHYRKFIEQEEGIAEISGDQGTNLCKDSKWN